MNLPGGSKISSLKTLLRSEVLLSRYSTFQIGGKAQYFSEPTSSTELKALVDFARLENLPFLVIGKGSNILFPDEGFPGLVITLIHFQQDHIVFDHTDQSVTASSGINLYRLAVASRDGGMSGLEFLSHVPGTLGGALIMNAGFSRLTGQKREIGDLVHEVTVLDSEGEIRRLGRDELSFQYRQSNLTGFVILEAKLQLTKAQKERIQQEIESNFGYRNGVQDLRYPSAGSVFKNPSSQPAPRSRGKGWVRGESSGQLIDQVGLKGKRIGGAMISDRHANFIVNTGGARAHDVIELVGLAQKRVFEAFGVQLEPEIRIISAPHELVSASS